MPRSPHLPDPRLSWSPARVPRSEAFDDAYHSVAGGLAEKRHVFLGGCQLSGGWRDSHVFVVGELGFGTGLNFLSTWDLWRRTKPPGGRLHYIAVEGYPLSPDELRECLSAWPELRQVIPGLLRAYPVPQRGFHRVFLDGGQVALTLLFGEATEMLAALEAQVDAWFLDGFSPDRNPAMWSAAVMAEVARLSKANARLASYTVAGEIRHTLSEAGFDVQRAPGFGAKREMLRGVFRRQAETKRPLQPWFSHAPAARLRRGHAAVVGAGLAGGNIARALMRRGWTVTVYDSGPAIATGASGHSVGVLMPRLTAAPSVDGRYYAAAWRFALDAIEDLADRGLPLLRDRCGALQLAISAEDVERHAMIAADPPMPEPFLFRVSAKEASELAGVPLATSALFFPQGGWLGPNLTCRALLDGIEVRVNSTVVGLRRASGTWTLLGDGESDLGSADIVVLANAMGAATIAQAGWLPLQARRGQVTWATPSVATRGLRAVLSFGGYMTPAHRGRHSVGATFDWVGDPMAPVVAVPGDGQRNLSLLAEALPGLALPSAEADDDWAAIRCTMPDHLPATGPIPDERAYLRDYAELRHGHAWARYPDATYHPGLYALVGLGARGLVSAPLAAEIAVSEILGDPWPVERDLVAALHPGRFLVRDLKRLRV